MNSSFKPLQELMKIPQLMWAVLMLSIFAYGMVTFMALQQQARQPASTTLIESHNTIGIVVIVAAGLAAACGWLLPGWMLSTRKIKATLDRPVRESLEQLTLADGRPMYSEEKLDEIASRPEAEQKAFLVYNLWFFPHLMSWALFESMALFGLVLAFVTRSILWFPALAIPAAILMLLRRPQLSDLLNLTQSHLRPRSTPES